MDEERFDAIIVGGGLAGSAAAYRLAMEEKNVLVIERGTTCGSKNMTGGRLYGHSLEKLIPGFAEEAPIERKVTKERISMTTADGSTTIEYMDKRLETTEAASYTVLRAPFDNWFAEKAEEAGAFYITGILVEELLQEDGKVVGVRCGEDELFADVVILADGVNSLLAQQIGLAHELDPKTMAVGVKEVIKLDEKTITDRFGVNPGEGVAWLFAGDATAGNIGGGFLYTNKESVSVGIVTTIADIGRCEVTVPEMVDRVTESAVVAPLLEGGEIIEYSAHMVGEGGYRAMPELYSDGVMVVGDAAGMVINLGVVVRGMDYAIESGRLAAEAYLKAAEAGDFSKNSLAVYKQLLDDSFIMKDLKQYQKAPELLEQHEMFNEIPNMMQEILGHMFTVDGTTPTPLKKKIFPLIKQSGGLFKLAKIGKTAMEVF